MQKPSRLRQLVPTVGKFYTRLPLRKAFEAYNSKYGVTSRKHVCISFNEIRHILNLAQIMALHSGGGDKFPSESKEHTEGKKDYETDEEDDKAAKRWSAVNDSPSLFVMESPLARVPPLDLDGPILPLNGLNISEKNELKPPISPKSSFSPRQKRFKGPRMISFDGDQTLYSDGANFDSNPKLATYLYLLLRHGVTVAVVTAAGYEYQTEKYELRLSGLLAFFKQKGLPQEDCERFYLFGGECNYLMKVSTISGSNLLCCCKYILSQHVRLVYFSF